MSRQDSLQDFASVLSLSGTAITTSYKSSSPVLPAGQPSRYSLWLYLTAASSGSTYTGCNVKLQASRDGVQWCDLQLTRSDNGTTANPGNATAPSAGTTQAYLFQTASGDPAPCGVRVQLEFTGAAGVAGDAAVVHLSVM